MNDFSRHFDPLHGLQNPVQKIWQDQVGLEELENLPDVNSGQSAADRGHALDRLLTLIQRLKPLDRHVILSYLEGLDAASIGAPACS
jgi:hypothetical protein